MQSSELNCFVGTKISDFRFQSYLPEALLLAQKILVILAQKTLLKE